MKPYNCKEGSAWHVWQVAGYKWRQETYANIKGALMLAAAGFASDSAGDLEYSAKKEAFIEGANILTRTEESRA